MGQGGGVSGVIFVAKTSDNVNTKYTHGFTSRKTDLVLGTHGMGGLDTLGRRLRGRCNTGVCLLPFSIHSHGTTASTLRSLPGR